MIPTTIIAFYAVAFTMAAVWVVRGMEGFQEDGRPLTVIFRRKSYWQRNKPHEMPWRETWYKIVALHCHAATAKGGRYGLR